MDNRLSRTLPSSEASTLSFMNKVYSWMVLGILITGLTAYLTAQGLPVLLTYLRYSPHGLNAFMTFFYCLLAFQLIQVLVLSFWLNKMKELTAILIYLVYTFTVGLTFSSIFIVYNQQDISSVFFITSFAFAGLSAYGYFTKKDLQFIGTFCTMGLFGLVGFGIYSLFSPHLLSDSTLATINVSGIIIFCGLTAFDTQKIKEFASKNKADEAQLEKAAIYGALTLYLDFINLFLKILARRKR